MAGHIRTDRQPRLETNTKESRSDEVISDAEGRAGTSEEIDS